MKAVACPELMDTDESEQLETRGDAVSDITRINELEPINAPSNDDLAIRNSKTGGPDVSMLGIDIFWRKYILDYIIAGLISKYLVFIDFFITL